MNVSRRPQAFLPCSSSKVVCTPGCYVQQVVKTVTRTPVTQPHPNGTIQQSHVPLAAVAESVSTAPSWKPPNRSPFVVPPPEDLQLQPVPRGRPGGRGGRWIPKGRVVIVGAGLSGVSAALAFARNGYHVTVIDKRPPPRFLPRNHHITLSSRGLECLTKLGVDLPPESYTRGPIMTCHPDGRMVDKSMYGRESVHIDRVQLAEVLVETARTQFPDRIHFTFRGEVFRTDLEGAVEMDAWSGGREVPQESRYRWIPYDLLVAADGANSTVREFAEEHSTGEFQVEYQQRHIKTAYKVVPHVRSAELAALTRGARVTNFVPAPGSPYKGLTAHRASNSYGFSFTVYRKIGTWLRSKTAIATSLVASFPQLPRGVIPGLAAGLLASLEGIAGPVIICPQLYYKSVLLMGDAGHACTNGLGQAGNCALEDAAALDDVLVGLEGASLQEAAQQWDQRRREEVAVLQELELKAGLLYPGQLVGQAAQGLAFGLLWAVNSFVLRLGFIMFSSGFKQLQIAGGSYKAAKRAFGHDFVVFAAMLLAALAVLVLAGLAGLAAARALA